MKGSFNTYQILDSTDPRIAFFKCLKGNAPRIEERNALLVEGDQQLERLLKTELPIQMLFMERRYYKKFAALLAYRDLSGTECYTADPDVMEQIVGYRLHQGVFALADRPSRAPSHLLKPPIVALNRVVDPENVGNIVRSCAAFGVHSLVCDSASCDPFLRRAVRVSMGGIFELSVSLVDTMSSYLNSIRDYATIIGIENTPSSEILQEFGMPENPVLVFGNERDGIDPEVLKVCDTVVRIPLSSPTINSLNVHTAAAIVLHHLSSNKGAAEQNEPYLRK